MEGETKKKPNTLPIWGNERTMNMNSMILTNIQASPYFKNQLYELKTYHAVVDEIYYKVRNVVVYYLVSQNANPSPSEMYSSGFDNASEGD
jgi:hypothetical protein